MKLAQNLLSQMMQLGIECGLFTCQVREITATPQSWLNIYLTQQYFANLQVKIILHLMKFYGQDNSHCI